MLSGLSFSQAPIDRARQLPEARPPWRSPRARRQRTERFLIYTLQRHEHVQRGFGPAASVEPASGDTDSLVERDGFEPSVPPFSKRRFQDSRLRFPVVRHWRSRGGLSSLGESALPPESCLPRRRAGSARAGCRNGRRSFQNPGGLFGRTHVPDAGGGERQLVRRRPERGQSIGDGVGHQAADRDDRALAGALDAERVAR